MSGGAEPRRSLSELTRFDMSSAPFQRALELVAELAPAVVGGCDQAGVTVTEGSGPTGRASSGAVAADLDTVQSRTGDGPCATCLASGTAESIDSTTDDRRWPGFSARAREQGVRSCLAIPLALDGAALGTLNLYGRAEGAFTGPTRPLALSLGHRASVLVGNARSYSALRARVADLYAELADPGDVVAQATGILAARGGVPVETARARLEASREPGTSLEAAARAVVETIPS